MEVGYLSFDDFGGLRDCVGWCFALDNTRKSTKVERLLARRLDFLKRSSPGIVFWVLSLYIYVYVLSFLSKKFDYFVPHRGCRRVRDLFLYFGYLGYLCIYM
ncbi:uncharacterized protein DS421_14g470500 [Arachis hypogaea]|nr:uncharacterized protein DS421_14g470500 [Arachis hypogaea]